MAENEKTFKKLFISEEDVSLLLRRYSATTILALLQEVARVPAKKYDWNEMVKKSDTGITNAREYQMLWRHLAYRAPLVEKLNDQEVKPLDDDSDLDCELEALPTVTPDASAEAAACVKVLIASGMPSNSTLPSGSTIEAPLTISIPNRQPARGPSVNSQPSTFVQGRNITVPVSVQKQPLPAVTPDTPATTAEGLESGNLPPRRKRKPWTDAEDAELLAAVKKCGEGNWANILKEQLMKERTASQLSQRWNIIKKRKSNSSSGGKGNSSLGGSSQLSEAQLAARRAMSIALNMPLTDKLMASSTRVSGPIMNQHEKSKADGASQRSVVMGLSSKSLVNSKTHSTKSSDEMVKATAVAAGARIGNPCDAVLLKNNNGSSLPSNVHYIRTGLSTTQSTYSSAPNDLRQVQKPAGVSKSLEGIVAKAVVHGGGQVPMDED